MVTSLDKRWNTLVPSLYLLHQKLERLGIVNDNGIIRYLGAGEQENV
jgi:hypothetical protein